MRPSAFVSAALVACVACGGDAPRRPAAPDTTTAASVPAPALPADALAPTASLPPDSQAQIGGLLSDGLLAESAGDSASARQLFAQALQLDPTNAELRARTGILAAPSSAAVVAARTAAARVRGGRVVATATGGEVVPTEVTAPSVLATAAEPVDTTARAVVRSAPARRTSTVAARTVAQRRRARLEARARRQAQLATVADSTDAPQAVAQVDGGVVMPSAKRKRTWPWTRAQRWLVAKGLTGGAGVGVVVGAIVGNVPGAVLAGSLGGGAVGFKKATKIGPAEPYPSEQKTAEFEPKKTTRTPAEVAARAAAVESAPASQVGQVASQEGAPGPDRP